MSVTGSNNKIDFCKKKGEMKNFISQSRIGLRPKSVYREKSIERMQTGTRPLNLRKQEDLFAGTGHLLISTQRTILLKKRHLQVEVKEKKY